VIHVLTCHHRTDQWVDLQLDALARHLHEPYRVHASIDGVANVDRFDQVTVDPGEHGPRLNRLAAATVAEADPDDLLIFCDSDALLIADPLPVIRVGLDTGAALVAVRRDENLGEPQPHPSLCAITARTWAEIGGDWRKGHRWTNSLGRPWTDTGANMIPALAGRAWKPLLRANTVNPHPVFFGVYAGIVYHHGAGSRVALCRADRAELGTDRAAIRARAQANAALARDRLQRIHDDPDGYWRDLVA